MLTERDKKWIANALGEALGILAQRLKPIRPREGGPNADYWYQHRATRNQVVEAIVGEEETLSEGRE